MHVKLQLSAFPLLLSMLFVGLSTTGAHAYLDAGTGSMILQVLLGGAAGLALAFKFYWHRFLTFLGLKPKLATAGEESSLSESKAQVDR